MLDSIDSTAFKNIAVVGAKLDPAFGDQVRDPDLSERFSENAVSETKDIQNLFNY